MNEEELYNSRRDEQPDIVEEKIFEPEPSPEYSIGEPVRTAAPVYTNAKPELNIIQKIVSRVQENDSPDMTLIERIKAVEEKPIPQNSGMRIYVDRLLTQFDEQNASKIIEAVQTKQPLDESISTILVANKIVEPVKFVKKKRVSVIDRITNTLYNLIYSKNGLKA